MNIKRPILRYHGGKWMLSKWIISNLPSHKQYIEPYGGGGSVLIRKKQSHAEIYNDLDCEVVNLFRVCRDLGPDLQRVISLTPFSREEFNISYEITEDPLERARRMIVRSFMGFGSAAATMQKTGFRSNSDKSGRTPAGDWTNFHGHLESITKRLHSVVIENMNALKLIEKHNKPDTLFYLDPPYLLDTRYMKQKTKCYQFEMSNSEHETMLNVIIGIDSIVVLSGYENELYNDILTGWTKITKQSFADGAKKRIEVLWINRSPNQPKLF